MEHLECVENQLTSLDVSNLYDLRLLYCGNNLLTSLDISNNLMLGVDVDYTECYLGIDTMQSLEEVCVWTMPFPPEGFKLQMEGSPNVYFTTECSQ